VRHRRGPDGGVDPMRWRRCIVEVDAEEEQAHGVNPTAVGEAVGEAPAWTRRRSGRQSARIRRLWRRGVVEEQVGAQVAVKWYQQA
jgi:hypothetical protein